MKDRYETEGTLEGNRVIRLKEPLPCKDGPVRVIVTPEAEQPEAGKLNRPALEALDRLLAERDDLSPDQWAKLEKVIQEEPLRIRRDSVG